MTNEQINKTISEIINGNNEGPFLNCCNDLNAMHEAEKTLSYKQKRTYCEKLFNLPTIELESNTFATARQRAEAFLKTIGKWEEQ